MGVEYVVRGGLMHCSLGTHDRKINLPVSHGSYVKGDPVMNKKDTATGANIPFFGICIKTGEICLPSVTGDWQNPKEDTLVEGQPAITEESIACCCEGGIITFVTSGQK